MTGSELYLQIKNNVGYTHTDADIDYAFYREGTTLYMLFQETRGKHDWQVNFDFPAKMYKHMIIHRGYAKAFKQVKEQLWKALEEETAKDCRQVIIAGWSKGSTEAILMAEEYYYRTGRKAYCITFGGPKVCYTIGTRNYLRKCILLLEYVQPNDFVTKVIPFCWRINKITVGEKFSLKKIFKTAYYHCNYDLVV